MKRELRYFLVNGFFAYSIYAGMYLKQEGFLNVALFYAWFAIIMSFFLLNYKVIEKAAAQILSFPIPKWFDMSFDTCIMTAFIYFGYVSLPIMYFIHICICQHAIVKAKELQTKDD